MIRFLGRDLPECREMRRGEQDPAVVDAGVDVIYGDTDSVFVALEDLHIRRHHAELNPTDADDLMLVAGPELGVAFKLCIFDGVRPQPGDRRIVR